MEHTLPAHATCNHKNYMLSCEVYEQMLADTGQRCEVCERPAEDNPGGKLYIDHDAHVGYWAVRGLLCNPCNSVLRSDAPPPAGPAFARYLENAWYRRQMAVRGLPYDGLAEPPEGSCVRDHRGKLWRRRAGRWICSDARYKVRDWRHLIAKTGPLGLTWVQPVEVPIRPADPESVAASLRAFMAPQDLARLLRLLAERKD
ncbi:endonuclease domain-containing protein [Nonomuraea indica]|uniref:endonuclease domain-containing protein n=1 Tax=Nonomuraea indica TaxID=1581193 RepID=UPI000C7E85BD|nr:endonuclease domain-containing protein [Nonomuraea indica]